MDHISRILNQQNIDVWDYSNRKLGDQGETLLHYYAGCPNKNKATWKLLLEHGADINATDNFGKSPLHQAVCCDNYEMAEWLLINGAYVEPHNLLGNTPLHYAAKGKTELCTLLLSHGADPNCMNMHKKTPLLHAVKITHNKIAELLLTYGGNATGIDTESSSLQIQDWCKQNVYNTKGSTFIPSNH